MHNRISEDGGRELAICVFTFALLSPLTKIPQLQLLIMNKAEICKLPVGCNRHQMQDGRCAAEHIARSPNVA